jgi:hypothetical protein
MSSSPRIHRPDDCSPATRDRARPRLEPVLALLAAASAGTAQLVTNVDALWVLLDAAAVLGAVFAVAMLLRALAAARARPALGELATGVVTGGLTAAVLLLALHGPQARVGALVLEVAAAMGALLTALVVGGAGVRLVRERPAAADRSGTPTIGRAAGWITVVAAAVAVAAVARDVAFR